MTENEIELLRIVRESDDPKAVAEYMFNLFSEYLQKHGPSQGTHPAAPLESA